MKCPICNKNKGILFGYGGRFLCLPCKRKLEKDKKLEWSECNV